MKFNDLTKNQPVFIHFNDRIPGCDDNGWLEVMVNTLIGDCEPNPGRELVEVCSPWLDCGWAMLDAQDLYPAPNFNITYQMVDVVERIPDDRVYEFGIGDINNADDPYYSQIQTKPTDQKKMVLLEKCDGCGSEFSPEWMMNASLGRACVDCYDKMSG